MEDLRLISNNCFKCKNAECINDCPIHNNIPKILSLYNNEQYLDAYNELINNNPLFFLCGLTCDHHKNCGKNCLYKKVHNERIKFELIEEDLYKRFNINYHFGEITKDKVAVIGSGPAGLMAAILFRKSGYDVTLFEKEKEVGGVLKYLIPDFRFDKFKLDNLYLKLKDFIDFKFAKEFGVDFDYNDLKEFKHVIFAMGTPNGVRELKNNNVINGLDLLNKNNDLNISFKGKKVAVLGLGNVAVDCARTLKRMDADVSIIYRRTIANSKASLEELEILNNEQIPIQELLSCVSYANGVAKFQKMKLSEKLIDGRHPFIKLNEFVDFKFDYLVEAYGSKPNIEYFKKQLPFKDYCLNGYVNVNNLGNTYFIGDYYLGASSIVKTISYTKNLVMRIINNDIMIDAIKVKCNNLPIYYGGSFNPITKAHKQIYLFLKAYLNNDIIIVPNGDLYPTKELLQFSDRIELINACLNYPIINKSLNDKQFNGTVSMLRSLNHPLFVMGSDSLKTITSWINYQDLIKENHFIVFKRSNDDVRKIILENELLNKYHDHFFIIDLDILDLSATLYRHNKDISVICESVKNIIEEKHFYE